MFISTCYVSGIVLTISHCPQDNLSVKFYYYPQFRVEEVEAKLLTQSQVAERGRA